MLLENKVAIITGAASGIGMEIAALFVREGARVTIADQDQERANAVANDLGGHEHAIGIAVDVTDEAEVEACVAKTVAAFGKVDILVSNAGIQTVAPLHEFEFERWKQLLAVHLDGAFLTTRACLREMYKHGRGGSIIYMGSVHSKEASVLKGPYVTAKHGLMGLAKVVAKEGAAHGVRANVICPGFVRTPLVDKQIPEQAKKLGHLRAGGHPERHAQGDGRRRVHHGRRCGADHPFPGRIPFKRTNGTINRRQSRLGYAVVGCRFRLRACSDHVFNGLVPMEFNPSEIEPAPDKE